MTDPLQALICCNEMEHPVYVMELLLNFVGTLTASYPFMILLLAGMGDIGWGDWPVVSVPAAFLGLSTITLVYMQ